MASGRVRSYCAGWRTLTPYMRNDRITQCDSVYMVRHPRGSYIAYKIAVSGSGHTGKQRKSFDAVIHMKENTHKVPKSASQAVLSRMLLTLHATRRTPHGDSRLVQAMSAWSVEIRRAASSWH